jgi:hypothetical protein
MEGRGRCAREPVGRLVNAAMIKPMIVGVHTNLATLVAEAIAAALRAELGEPHQAIKTEMHWTSACERAAKNWLAAREDLPGYPDARLS